MKEPKIDISQKKCYGAKSEDNDRPKETRSERQEQNLRNSDRFVHSNQSKKIMN